MTQTSSSCQSCQGKGWLLAENSGELEIQRCDTCCTFLTDSGALKHLVEEFEKLSKLRDICKDILTSAIPSGCSEVKYAKERKFFLGTFTVNGSKLEQISNILNSK
jgi:hypothetical protein